MLQRFTTLFPVWAVGLGLVAYLVPRPFAAARGAIGPLLGVVMLGMGLSLTGQSFALVLDAPCGGRRRTKPLTGPTSRAIIDP